MTRRKPSFPHLTDRETEIMEILWLNGPLFVRDMLASYPDPKPHVNTVSTIVRILEDKGYVAHEAIGSSHRYFAVAQPSEFADRSLSQIIKSFFSGSAKAAVSALVKNEKISVDELRQIIDMVERNDNK